MTKTAKNSLRRRARKRLPELLSRQGCKCYWCKTAIKHNTDDINAHDRATVDHIKPIAYGGRNGNNIVAACLGCNQRRNQITQFQRYLYIS